MKKIALAAIAVMTFSAVSAEEEVVVSEQVAPATENAFNAFYLGLGVGGSFIKHDVKGANEKSNRFIGSVVLGAGKTFKQKFYVGAEALMDFTKSKTKTVKSENKDIELKYQGITPQIAARLGYVNPCWKTLFYGKVGMAFNKGKARDIAANTEVSKNKVGLVLGLGAEKMFCKKFSARLEGDYNFGGKHNGNKFNKGFTIRALVAYNINY